MQQEGTRDILKLCYQLNIKVFDYDLNNRTHRWIEVKESNPLLDELAEQLDISIIEDPTAKDTIKIPKAPTTEYEMSFNKIKVILEFCYAENIPVKIINSNCIEMKKPNNRITEIAQFYGIEIKITTVNSRLVQATKEVAKHAEVKGLYEI